MQKRSYVGEVWIFYGTTHCFLDHTKMGNVFQMMTISVCAFFDTISAQFNMRQRMPKYWMY